jgi:Fibronectin type III domain
LIFNGIITGYPVCAAEVMARLHLGLRALICGACLFVLPQTLYAATVTLQWDPNTEADLRGYVLKWGTSSGVYTQSVNVGKATTYTVTLTVPGSKKYYFTVLAYNDAGISGPAAEVSTLVTNPITQPRLAIDFPRPSQLLPPDFLFSGWAADLGATGNSGIDAVHVYAYPNPGSGAPPIFLGVASYGSPRGDVAAAFGSRTLNSGYSLPVAALAPGTYDLVAFGHSTVANAFNVAQAVRIRVAPAPSPGATMLTIDVPGPNASVTGALYVGGWALDLRSTSGTGVSRVDLWAYPSPGSGQMPIYLGMAQYGLARPDVGGIFGSRFTPSGYGATIANLSAGTYDIVAMALSKKTGGWDVSRVRRINVAPSVFVAIDTPRPNAVKVGSFNIQGWALDFHSTTNTGVDAVHVWAYKNPGSGTAPIFLGSATMNVSRPDVGAAFGARYATAGYFLATPPDLDAGVYDLVLFPHSSITGRFESPSVIRVTVQ